MFSTAPAAAASDEKGTREMTSGEKPERESSKKKASGQKKLGEDVDIDLFCCCSSLLSTLSHFFGSPSSFSLKNPSNLLFEKKRKKDPRCCVGVKNLQNAFSAVVVFLVV
jgi:hypothetical protein